jgi:hypothetical protein
MGEFYKWIREMAKRGCTYLIERVAERIPMPDYMSEQMPEMMPQVMNNLRPHMIGDVEPLVTQPMINYLRGSRGK